MIKAKIAEKMNQIKKNKKGFTLIELIVVIAIIGVLAALLVPSMMGYVNDARVAKNEANARTIFTAAQATQAGLVSPLKGELTLTGTQGSVSIKAKASETIDLTEFNESFKALLGSGVSGSYSIQIDEDGNVTKVIYCVKASYSAPTTEVSGAEYGIYPPAAK